MTQKTATGLELKQEGLIAQLELGSSGLDILDEVLKLERDIILSEDKISSEDLKVKYPDLPYELAQHSSDKRTLKVAVDGTDKEKLWALKMLLDELYMTEYVDYDEKAEILKVEKIIEGVLEKL